MSEGGRGRRVVRGRDGVRVRVRIERRCIDRLQMPFKKMQF